ncbi:MAG: hypothetical protein AAFQ27_12215 [Pseudomonadota bacterium]
MTTTTTTKSGSSAEKSLSRRQFGAMTGAAAVAAGTPGIAHAANSASAAQLAESSVEIGGMNAYFIHPTKGSHPAVLSWRDSATLDAANRNTARRLAKKGYAVLVLDRDGGHAPAIQGDSEAALKWLESQPQIDADIGIGTAEWAEHRDAR